MIINCKMCGGQIEVSEDMTIAKCRYCGSTMTIPRIESEKKARLFNRANQYRLNNEFDKAYDAYKSIVDEDEQEAEGYWGMLLAEYGVEYVEDPKTEKRVPTCHRTKLQSILDTSNYNLACKYADVESRFMYQDEAEVIDSIQKQIIAVTAKEEPYDVFICYKETDDESGARTDDSVLAYDIYESLEKRGIRTFFSRVTLEDKLGRDYEPYIYAALRSARVLLLVTTKAFYVQAVWVKNEWKRYLAFMEEDRNKVLIPVYKGISPYELPGELSKFQSLDIGKVGASQDLVHAIEKILGQKKAEHRDDHLINELAADKAKRDATHQKTMKLVKGGAVVLLSVLPIIFLYLFNSIIYLNGDHKYSVREFLTRFSSLSRIFICGSVVLVLISLYFAITAFRAKHTRIDTPLFGLGLLVYGLGIFRVTRYTLRPSVFVILSVAFGGALLGALAVTHFVGRRFIQAAISTICLIAVTVIILLSSIGKISPCSNGENKYVNQVSIISDYTDIRKNAAKNSAKLGEAYKGDYYNLQNSLEEDGVTWYEIETNSGIHGFIAAESQLYVANIKDRIIKALEDEDVNGAIEFLSNIDAEGFDQNFRDSLNTAIGNIIWNKAADGKADEAEEIIERLRNPERKLIENITAFVPEWENALKEGKKEKRRREDYSRAVMRLKNIDRNSSDEMEEALDWLADLASLSYLDSEEKLEEMLRATYSKAGEFFNKREYAKARKLYLILKQYEYLDSATLYVTCLDEEHKAEEKNKEEEELAKKKKWEEQFDRISQINGVWYGHDDHFGEKLRLTVYKDKPNLLYISQLSGAEQKGVVSVEYLDGARRYDLLGSGVNGQATSMAVIRLNENGKELTCSKTGGISFFNYSTYSFVSK